MMTESLMEILKALISAIVGATVTIVFLYFQNRRGNRVVVSRVSETPQIGISQAVRQNLDILYKGQSVNNLVLNTLRLENSGKDVIEPLEIELSTDVTQPETAD